MQSNQRSTVVGVFRDHAEADRAVADLRRAGFTDSDIGLVGRSPEGMATTTTGGHTEEHTSAASEGALAGALTGAGLGGLVGLGILAGIIPAIGPVIAGGTLMALIANAGAGAAIGTLAGSLVGSGVPEDEANYYHGEFEQGRTIVTVKAGSRYDEAATILRNHGAYDMHTQAAGSVTGSPTAATTHRPASAASVSSATHASAAPAASTRRTSGDQTIEVREEELSAHKRPVAAGEVTVRKEVHTEHKTIDVPVQREEVVIERHAPTGRHTSAGEIRPGEEIRIPVSEEQVTVDKKTVVKEEVSVGKRVVQGTERVGGEVRSEEVKIEREGDVKIHTDKGKNTK